MLQENSRVPTVISEGLHRSQDYSPGFMVTDVSAASLSHYCQVCTWTC